MKKTFTITAEDTVWLMHGNRAVCATVVKVSYKKFISSLDYESVIENELYTLSVGDKQLAGLHGKDELFPTKSDLINSL
jgi:hypothetical protein